MTEKIRVLHFDDDSFEIERMRRHLDPNRYEFKSCNQFGEFLNVINHELFEPDVFIQDVFLDDTERDGIAVIQTIRERFPYAVIIVSSSLDDPRTIARAFSVGADDFISKICEEFEVDFRIQNALRVSQLKRNVLDSSTRSNPKIFAEDVIGATMQRLAQRIPRLMESAINAVFVGGESGTGKEVVASLFQRNIPPSTPFVRVNCGSFATGILESELFGHVRGSFTGAVADKKGWIESADGGWIFLDEIATLSSSAQVALLRALENQEVTRVGSTKTITVNFRLISATNENIELLVEEKKFRGDLWQRLRETEILLPPLRDRKDEIPEIIQYFLKIMRGGPYTISGPTLSVLGAYDWPQGNVRELRNCLRAMTEFSANKQLTPITIPQRIFKEEQTQENVAADFSADKIGVNFPKSSPFKFAEMEDELLVCCVEKVASHFGNLTLRQLSTTMGMSRSTLTSRIKEMMRSGRMDPSRIEKILNLSL